MGLCRLLERGQTDSLVNTPSSIDVDAFIHGLITPHLRYQRFGGEGYGVLVAR